VGDVGRRGWLQNLANGPFGPGMADDAFGGPQPDNAHLAGAILRLNDDGTTPADNPFFGAGSAIGGEVGANVQRLFSYGIRNSFGMAFDPPSGALWAQENGDDSFDELNRVDSGSNSGWAQIMGPPERISQYKAIETDPTAPQPFATDGYLGLQQVRWPPSNIADNPAAGMGGLFQLPGAQFSAPEFSWKFSVAPGGLGFLTGSALGGGYANDLFVGAARDSLKGGYLFHFDVDAARGLALGDPRLVDLVADNLNKFELTESETLLFGCDFGATTDIQTGPNGNLFVVSDSHGAVYEILPALPGAAPGSCSASPPPAEPEPEPEPVQPVDPLSLELEAKKQALGKRLKIFATASSDSTLVAKGRSIKTETLPLTADQRTKVAAKLRRKQQRRLAERLDKKGRAKARVKATATDSGGAAAADRVTVKLKAS
jgi:Glucose / Sorbosone dehydrogenase